MESKITDRFVSNLFCLYKADFPKPVYVQAKKCVLDYIGVTFAGARMLEEKSNRLLNLFGREHGDNIVIGFSRKATTYNAILLNGLNAHVAELDDGHRFGLVHPGAPIISALIPIAEHENINGKDFLKSVIIGYQAAVMLGTMLQPSHKQLGYHGTGTCGTIGATVGVASALGFSESRMKDAISASSTTASGFLEVIEDKSELKPFHAGRAALNGFVSAMMAQAGFVGPDDILGGKRGLVSIMTSQRDFSCLERTLEDPFAIEKIYMKPYVGCRHCHPAIEAALKIRTRYGILTKDIKSVKVRTYGFAVDGHDHTLIQGVSSAKMSTPYSVAVALEYGKAGISEFTDEYVNAPHLSTVIRKVQVVADDELSALVPQKRAAIVEIITNNNQCFTERVDYPRGEPENPMTEAEITEKFVSLAQYGNKTKKEAYEIIDCVWNLENNLHSLFDLLQ